MKQTLLIIITVSLVLTFFPLPTYAITLVPCGRSDQQPTKGELYDAEKYPDARCNFRHLIIMITRLINYLITVSAVVAMYQVLLAGFNMVTSLGNPEKIKLARTGISNALVGFGMVAMAFVFINLLVNGIFGDPDAPRHWWDPKCIYSIQPQEKGGECPFGIAAPKHKE